MTILKEGCFELGLAALISTRMSNTGRINLPADFFQLIIAVLSIVLLLSSPILLTILARNAKKLLQIEFRSVEEEEKLQKNIKAFKDYRKKTYYFPIIFFIRRFTLVFLLTLTPRYTRIQMYLYGVLSLVVLFCILVKPPYSTSL